MDNEQRIAIGLTALTAAQPLLDEDNTEENITDLIANLLHLADDQGLDVDRIASSAKRHFEYEK